MSDTDTSEAQIAGPDRGTRVHIPTAPPGKIFIVPPEDELGRMPTIFLAGPVRNAPKWQEEAIRLLVETNESVFVASPTRYVSDDIVPFLEVDSPAGDYIVVDRQRDWELRYLELAEEYGCILVWLPAEAEVKEHPEKIYAHITMMELGGLITKCESNEKINLVIGTDRKFPEWPTILFDLETKVPHVQIHYTLKEAVEAALDLALFADEPAEN